MKSKIIIGLIILLSDFLSGCSNSSEVVYKVTGEASDIDIMVYYSEGYKDKTKTFTSVSLPWIYTVDIVNDEGLLGEEHSDKLYLCVNKKNNDNQSITAVIEAEGTDTRTGTVSVPYGNLCVSSEVLVDTAPTLD